ncbi:thiol reductant ABC exporter subunit CydC [Oceanobacillus oncorhynchi subsp. incaldanensis]|uniref:thiol reductant ABC exporter subunit CydC n=1 Tax=Oceanobacillus oncorhynchi TaxID=545501 RepID=UPI001AFF8AD4|nr:thiol reductant ABC exporter subunit CydC [Oceanobacillus oncorhynchi]GIO19986.1 thiol reductant ABC exporter subunit CydC [Oceanobacillus oncorhynchi subsp. incaldanensis]
MKDISLVLKMMLKEKRDILISIFFGFLAGITAVSLFAASGYLISQAAFAPPIYTLMILVASVKLLGITSAVSRYGERYFSHRGTFTILKNIRLKVYDQIEPLASRLLQKYRSGDILARIVGDVESLQHFFLRVFYPPVVLAAVFTATIFFTMYLSIGVAMTMIGGVIIVLVVFPSIFYLFQKKTAVTMREKRGALSSEFTDYLYGFRELTIFQQAERKKQQLDNNMKQYEEIKAKENRQLAIREAVVIFFSFFIAVIILVQAGFYVSEGNLAGTLLAMLFMIAITVFEDTPSMAVLPAHLEESKASSKRLTEVWEKETQTEEAVHEIETDVPIQFDFKDVSIQYPTEKKPAVRLAAFQIKPGTNIAIVGPSGSGKSTLMQAMLTFAPIQSGQLLVNGEELDKIAPDSLWRQLNVSLQHNHFFYGSIYENLRFANKEAGEEACQEALEKVQLSHFSLEDQVLEKGTNLSGGEKQRLALARLFLRDASVWLLDEPTSSLDAITEQEIMEEIEKATKYQTVVTIRHRLTGLEKMDQIIVMNHGEVVEQGTYMELMRKKDGYFKAMKELENSQLV